MTNKIVLALVIESRNHKRKPLINNRRKRHKTNHMKRNIPDELKRFDPKEGAELGEQDATPEPATEEGTSDEGEE